MHEIEASFREQKERARARRRRRRFNRILAGVGAVMLVAIAAGAWWTADLWIPAADEPVQAASEDGGEAPVADRMVYVPAIVDLAGDPLLISVGGGLDDGPRLRAVPRPAGLMQPGISERIEFLSDVMVSSSERFMTTLPSRPEDFAFFQAQSARSGGPRPDFDAQDGAAAEETFAPTPAEFEEEFASGPAAIEDDPEDDFEEFDFELTPVDGQNDGAAAAALIASGELEPEYEEDGALSAIESIPSVYTPPEGAQGLPGDDASAGWGGREALPEFERTRIANTTSVRFVVREADRARATDDVFVRVFSSRTIDSFVVEHRFFPEDARKVGEAAKDLLDIETLKAGDVLAMRGYRPGGGRGLMQPVQVSIYSGEDYVGTLAVSDQGDYGIGADPWVRDDLFNYAREAPGEETVRQYRLLDAVYSTAVRNNVPQGVIGETIRLISRAGFDLNAFANHDDRLVLAYSQTPRDGQANTGRVLFAAIRGRDRDFRCFVYQPRPGGEFACMGEGDQEDTLTVTNGMVTPVNGVMTSGFGPRNHPILNRVRLHSGVDWAAPIGTPVMAAFDGTVDFVGENGGFGNFIRLKHSGNRATGYAHLDRFATGIAAGRKVSAGDVIGFVGTTGLSTGPHLHFELYQGGRPINPLGTAVAGGSDATAVDTLVARIIRVESAGDARAKNPLSTATGLGQFIESTWLRMMRTYRPDLARSLSRADLLALRFDPELSREMVANLARESEARLRSFGHQITAGRLYLAHFLGVDGANRVLSANPTAAIETVVDAGVVPANPFLRGMTAADIVAWAERKMRGRGAPAPVTTTRRVVRTSPEAQRFREAMTAFLEEAGAVL